MRTLRKFGFVFFTITILLVMSACPGITDNGIENGNGGTTTNIYRAVDDVESIATSEKAVVSWAKPAENWFGVRIVISPEVTEWDSTKVYKDETSVLIQELTAETQYTFTFITVDEKGEDTDKTTSLELTTPNAAEPIIKEIPVEVIKEIEKPADKTLAGKVTNLDITTGDAIVSLSWKNPNDEDLYGVEITVSEDESSYSFIVKKSVEAYVVYGLKNETEYTFSIKSIDNSLNLSEEETITAMPTDSSDKTPAGKVANLIATPYDSMVSLSWQNPDDEDLYGVEITVSDDKNSYSIVVRKPTEEYRVYGLTNEKEYTFSVKSIDNSLNLSEAENVKATPVDSSDKTPPADVTAFTATAMDSKIMLSWTNPTDTDFSGVEISCEPKTGSMTHPQILKNGATSILVYGLENGTEYTFTAKTFDNSGNISAGTSCTATPVDSSDKTPPDEATDFSTVAMDSKILLSWTNPEDEDFLGVEISCEPKAGSLGNPVILKKGVTSLIVYGLENRTEYTFTIRTFDESGNFSTGAISTSTPIDSSDKTPPDEATDFSASAMDSKILLSWTNPNDTDFSGVEISCKQKAGSLANPITLKKDVISLIVYGLENGTEYTFTVKTFDKSGNFSTGVTFTGTPVDSSDKTPPTEVTSFTATAMDSKVTLSWTNPTDTDFSGVEVSCEPKAGTLASPIVLKKDTTSLTVHGLTNGKTYTFKIKTFDKNGNISAGTSCTATPVDSSDKTPPADVTDFTATAMDSKVSLSWTNPTDTDFSGMEISCEPKAGTLTKSIILKNNTTSFIVHGLTNGTEYTFTIKTFDTSDNFSIGTTCTVKTKIPLGGITINYEGQNDIKGLEHTISDESITFTAPDGYKNYKWRLDNKLLETNEETPNSITIERASLSGGVHSLMLIVSGMYSASCTITVKDGENFSDFSQVENTK